MLVYPNAKINIGLSVTEKRGDGFHNLETVFYPVDLMDILEINRTTGMPGDCFFKNTGIEVDCTADKNLVIRAYKLLAVDYRLPAVAIHLHKIIPFGAGLGGGSSDAAFMLNALNVYFELNIPEEALIGYAARLGSDCAFFIKNRPAFASGKGEVLEDLDLSLDGYNIILVKPAEGVSTAEAYAGIIPHKASFDLRKLGTISPTAWREYIVNDFEKTVFTRYPEIKRIKERLYESGALYASMTGSGSAVYGIFDAKTDNTFDFPGCFIWKNDDK